MWGGCRRGKAERSVQCGGAAALGGTVLGGGAVLGRGQVSGRGAVSGRGCSARRGARKGGQAGQKCKAKGREGKEAGGGSPQRLPYVERCRRPRATKKVVSEVVEWVEHMPKVLAGWEGQGEPDRLLGAKRAGAVQGGMTQERAVHAAQVDGAPQHTDQQVHAPPADGRTRAERRSMVEAPGTTRTANPPLEPEDVEMPDATSPEGPGSYVGDHGDVDSEGESSADEGDADEMDVDDLATSVMPGALSFSSFASGGGIHGHEG
ncbi:hypothetical protein B0H10DRAFT_1954829 [Mycena sp. CBHHK59/15]|nr:hypothetical protein B0H10DRAFT_1954829 [Mycena sp. CBHHK59/15]